MARHSLVFTALLGACGFREVPLEPACFLYVVGSDSHSCARKSDGTLWCWGSNQYGQLGTGDTDPRYEPTEVHLDSLGSDVGGIYVPVGTGDVSSRTAFTCALKTDGTLWCWGNNEYGQLGTGDTRNRLTPVQVRELGADVHAASLGSGFACARKNDYSLWCWGANESGQLGTGDTDTRTKPTRADTGDLALAVRRLSIGTTHTCVRKTDNTLWCWGDNRSGQLGTGDTMTRLVPTQIDPLNMTNIDVIVTGGAHSCAMRSDATLWCWGANQYGQLGLDDFMPRASPVQVDLASFAGGVPSVTAGGNHTCAAQTDGTLFCWGDNRAGQLGNGGAENSAVPVQVDISALGKDVYLVYAGGRHTCTRNNDSSLWCWGGNEYGQLGIGRSGPSARTPERVAPACP
jgi:alpha-tubulin suppressor-like RCC1 family protein